MVDGGESRRRGGDPAQVDTLPGPGGRRGPGTRVLAAIISGRREHDLEARDLEAKA